MAYTKHNWMKRLGTGLNKFRDTITNTVFQLVNEPDTITQEGTPIREDWLNEMEDGIENATNVAEGIRDGGITAYNAARLDGYIPSSFMFTNNPKVNEHLNMNNKRIYNVGNPNSSDDALNRGYADGRYLGKLAKAADSAKLDGRIVSYDNTYGTIVRRSSTDGTIKVGYIKERGQYIHNRYQKKISYGTSVPSSLEVGEVFIKI